MHKLQGRFNFDPYNYWGFLNGKWQFCRTDNNKYTTTTQKQVKTIVNK